MTDQQLLDLLALKAPEDLSQEELEQLRSKLGASPTLQKLLLQELQMASYFEDAFARLNTTLPAVLAEGKQQQQKNRQPIWPAAAYVLAMIGVAYGGGWLFSPRNAPPLVAVVEQPQTGDQPTNKPDVEPATEPGEPPPATPDTEAPAVPPAANPQAVDSQPAEPHAGKPWAAVMNQQPPLPKFQDVACQEFDREKHLLRASELKQWLNNVPGMEGKLSDDEQNRLRFARFYGHQRLLSPWQKDVALKFWVDSHNKFQMHFFRGERGVTLAFYEDQGARWVAYETKRQAGHVRPDQWALAATDFYRTWRCQMHFGGSYELRFSGEELILTRGDIVLLRASFSDIPEESFFDGQALVHGIRLVRTEDLPPTEAAPPLVFDTDKPADLTWKLRSDKGPAIERLPTGGVRFATTIPLAERAEISTPLPKTGMHEVIFQIEDATAGAGVFLGRKDGASYEVVRFMYNPRMKHLQLAGRMGWDDQAEGEGRWPKDQPTAATQNNAWIKLIFGLGTLIWQVSTDGEHWGVADLPIDYVPGNVTSVGLQLVAQRPNVGLTLKRLQLREFTGLTSLATPAELERAVAVTHVPFIGLWFMEIAAQRPADISWPEWQRICAVKTLLAGAPRSVSSPLVDLLLDDAVQRQLPAPQVLAALADVGRFGIEYRDRQAFQTGLMRRYWEVASYSEDAFDEIWRQWQTVPINSLYIDNPSFEPLVRKELFKRIYTRPSAETQAFVQRAKFYHLDEQVPLIRWADYISRRESPNRGPKESNAAIRDGWPHPLIEEVSKEAYNVTSDLRSVLESDAIEDAARMISRLDLGQIQGLTTAVDDRALFVSASNSIKAALLRQPQLEQLLAEKYGKLARLRFEEATAAGNAAAMENLALQFHATEAGAEAHKWLGERALAEGRFELAVAEFKRASEHGSATILREMEPLQRLAAAMLGREAGSAVEREVAFGTTRFTPAEFENLVEEMRNRGQQVGVVAGTVTAGEPASAAIPPTGLQAERRGAFDGPSGDRHTEEGARHVNHYKLPWVDRQLAVAVEQDTAYVSNRFQVAAYDLTNGQRKWQSQPPPGLKVKRAQEAALVTARPLVFAKRIIVRQMYGDGFLLTCLNKDDGKLVWMLPFKEPEHLLSDPFWLYGSLVAITGWRETTDYVLRWTVFDAETGAIEQQKDILRLKQSWLRRPSLELALLDDGVVVQGAGSVFQLDAAGNTRWLRKFVWSPEEEDPRAVVQSFQKPIVDNGKLYVTQPGVRCVTCLDATTGWQRWTRVLPELCGILGLVDSRLIVQQENELLALDAADGHIVWRQRLGETHPAWICNQDWLISVEREKLDPAKETRTNRVVWRETKTGEVVGSTRLTGFDDDDPRFGLLLAQREKLWTFAGKSQSDPNRTLVELRPQGEIERSLTERTPIWVKGLDPKLNPSKKPFPQFSLLQGLPGDKAGHHSDMHGEKDVFGARSWFDKPVAWLYTGVLPTDTNRLKLKIGVDDGVAWKLRVTVNGKRLIDEEFKPQKDRWVERELPLAEFRDQDVVLVVAAYATDGVERVIYFKRLQVE